MQSVQQPQHQFYSPVTNWKSKNRRRQRYLTVQTHKKTKSLKSPTSQKTLKSFSAAEEPISHLPKRSHSLTCTGTAKVSPSATSEPIAIPSSFSSNKNVKSIEKETESQILPPKVNQVTNTVMTSSPSTTPTLKFKKCSTFEEPKHLDSSLVALFKNSNVKPTLKEKGDRYVPKINTSNLKGSLERKMNSFESSTLIDSAFTESSSFTNLGKSFMKSPELSYSSVSTLCMSPSLASTTSQEIESSSVLTLCGSPTSEVMTPFHNNLSNDQLFKLLPKKIIRALENYTAHASTEISYKKGDFFFVISENEAYYYVTNPSTKTSGYVLKYSFEQVDNFSNPNKPKSCLSPIVEKKNSKIYQRNPLTDRIMTASITEEIISRNTQNTFPIEITKIDGTVAVLYRSYNDVCQLHHSLLECFPEVTGSNTKERILPFLPSHDAIFNHPKKSPRQILSNYLQMLTRLPNTIQFSQPFEQFFNIRKDDILSSIYVVSQLNFFETDVNENEGKEDSTTIKVKIITESSSSEVPEVNILRVSSSIEYFDLFDMLEERCQTTFTNIYYQNEANEKVKVFGDNDLKLFFNSNNLSYVLWAK